MTVKELLNVFLHLEKITFFFGDDFETIDTNAEYSFKAIIKHYNEKVRWADMFGHKHILIRIENE